MPSLSPAGHAKVEDLWSALTDRARIPRWFPPVSGDLELDGRGKGPRVPRVEIAVLKTPNRGGGRRGSRARARGRPGCGASGASPAGPPLTTDPP